MRLNILLILSCILLLAACKTPQGARGAKLKKRSADYVQKQMMQNQFEAKTVSAKAKIKFTDADRSMTVFSSIKMKKDSVIWLNAKAFGIEAGRVLIRPDSIFVLDRLNKRYMAKDIWWLQDEFGLPVDFQGLQAMLFGNPIFFDSDLTIEQDSLYYILGSKDDRYETAYKANGATFKLVEMLISQPKDQRMGLIQLSDYQTLPNGQSFSFNRNIGMNSPETGKTTVKIEMNKVEVDEPVNISFSIPDRYEKAN